MDADEAAKASRRRRLRSRTRSISRATSGVLLFAVLLSLASILVFGGPPFLLSPESEATVVGSSWSMFGGNPQLTHVRQEPSTPVLGDLRWSVDLLESVRTPPALSADTLFVASETGTVTAIETATGETRWRVPQATRSPNAVVMAGESVVIVGKAGETIALDASTGNDRWRAELGGRSAATPAVTEDMIYLAIEHRGVVALDRASGEERWTRPLGAWSRSSPLVADGILYIGSPGGFLYFLDAATGAVRTTLDIQAPLFSPTALYDDTLYIVDRDGWMRAIDARPRVRTWHGETAIREWWGLLRLRQPIPIPPPPPATVVVRWIRQIESRVPVTYAVAPAHVYVVSATGIEALRRDTGAVAWQVEEPAEMTAPAVTEDAVFVATLDGVVLALSPAEGASLWRRELGGTLRLPPSVNSDGLHFVTTDGVVHQLR